MTPTIELTQVKKRIKYQVLDCFKHIQSNDMYMICSYFIPNYPNVEEGTKYFLMNLRTGMNYGEPNYIISSVFAEFEHLFVPVNGVMITGSYE